MEGSAHNAADSNFHNPKREQPEQCGCSVDAGPLHARLFEVIAAGSELSFRDQGGSVSCTRWLCRCSTLLRCANGRMPLGRPGKRKPKSFGEWANASRGLPCS